MIRPLDIGAPINAQRYAKWLASFSVYWRPVTQHLIELWINQFDVVDRDLAARVLDATLFINSPTIHQSYRDLLITIPAWHPNQQRRHGRWYFVPFSGSTGESGDSMLHTFRIANDMAYARYDRIFVHRSQLASFELTETDTVIMVDDFSGSGQQACDSWHEIFAELIIGNPRIFLLLIAATNNAVRRITSETPIEVRTSRTLTSRHNIFHDNCNFFTVAEKARLLHYCQIANNAHPRGFNDSGLLVTFNHRCPNNSIPILHSDHPNWAGLFPRS